MPTPEIIWLVHEDTKQSLRDSQPGKYRRYLLDTGDMTALRTWDLGQMKSSSNKR